MEKPRLSQIWDWDIPPRSTKFGRYKDTTDIKYCSTSKLIFELLQLTLSLISFLPSSSLPSSSAQNFPIMPEITPELKTYHGNCHCGAFKFTIKMPEITTVTQCNCSICFKKGYRWVFPGEGCFEITKGEGTLRDYHFGQRTMAHRVIPPTIYLTRMVLMDLVLSNMWIEYTRVPLQHSSGKRYWYQCKLEVATISHVFIPQRWITDNCLGQFSPRCRSVVLES